MVSEIWKPYTTDPTYEASSLGRVRNKTTGRILKQWYSQAGYLTVSMKDKNMKAHRIVATAFLGKHPKSRPQVNHKNGIKDDNRPENLEWCNARENQRHASRVLGKRMGDKNPNVKITAAIARDVLDRHERGESLTAIGRAFGVNRNCVRCHVRGLYLNGKLAIDAKIASLGGAG